MLRPVDPKARYKNERQVPKSLTTPEGFDFAVDQAILANLMPEAPFIDRATPITTIGSCFAGNIAAALEAAGYKVGHMDISERLFNPFALQDFIKSLSSPEDLAALPEHQRKGGAYLAKTLAKSKLLIVTFGLSFVWIDKATGQIVVDPAEKIGARFIVKQPQRFVMEPTGVTQNVDAMTATIETVRKVNPDIKIVLTLSPVHMARAVSDYPGVAADAISKSTLRCALHEVMKLSMKDVYYFPSFEILRWFGPMVDVTFGARDILHIDPKWVEYTLSKFRQYYCVGEQPIPPPFIHRKTVELEAYPDLPDER